MWFITVDVNLDQRAEVVLIRLHCKVTPYPTPVHAVFLGRKLICTGHTWPGNSVGPSWVEYLQELSENFLHGRFIYSQFIYSMIYLYQYGLLSLFYTLGFNKVVLHFAAQGVERRSFGSLLCPSDRPLIVRFVCFSEQCATFWHYFCPRLLQCISCLLVPFTGGWYLRPSSGCYLCSLLLECCRF